MKDVKHLKCFIASPSDVESEREECEKVIATINREVANPRSIHIEAVKWETHSHAAIGSDGQAVLNEQLCPEEADIFIGVFWCRFGSPTPRSGSGTAEEFERAFSRWQKDHSNRIQFYFKTAAQQPDKIDCAQLEKVKAFKKKIGGGCGCFYREFKDLDEFKMLVRSALIAEIESACSGGIQYSEKKISIQDELDRELNTALSLYSHQKIVWLDRKFCDSDGADITSLADSHAKGKDVRILLEGDESYVVKAPPQYGLTCLAHYLRAEAWKLGKAWIYIDAATVKLRKIEEIIRFDCERFGGVPITGVIIDSWDATSPSGQKILELLSIQLPDVKTIVMQSSLDRIQLLKATPIKLPRTFKTVYLLPLAKRDVRKAVNAYGKRFSDDEDSMLNKIVLNMEVLNIHRTPMNCWTLLKVAEGDVDLGPINRTEMLERVLFVLFSLDLPSYTALPDVQDCERLLGAFCEILVREERTDFTEEEFRECSAAYIQDKLIDIDINAMWRILSDNKIVVRVYGYVYRFCASFWLFFFAAKQMEIQDEFKNYILGEKRYAQYPEIVEFYTGCGRDKVDVLQLLDADLLSTREIMSHKLGFRKSFNPLKLLSWRSSKDDAEKMQKDIAKAVERSKVSNEIKDYYADKRYNFSRPYDQSIHRYVEGASFYLFIQQLRALSRALRNSDYVDPEARLKILQHIISGWSEIARVMFFMTPVLATVGQAFFEGYGFRLDDDFRIGDPSEKEMFVRVLQACPHNVIWMVKDDLASSRQAPLLYKWDYGGAPDVARHLFILYLIHVQPRDWDARVRSYINNVPVDSFYLLNVLNALRYQFSYGYSTAENDGRIKLLIKACVARHQQCNINAVGRDVIPGKSGDETFPT